MNFNFFKSLLKKTTPKQNIPDSIIIKRLEELTDIHLYKNITIYHHTKNLFIPLMILDPKKGLYIFEYKEWSYDDLKDVKVLKASKQESTNNTLSFEKKHDFIKTKFNELIHSDGVEIFNCLIMPNLHSKEYDKLDDTFKKLLPTNSIIFNNTKKNEISNKLHLIAKENKKLPNIENIIGNLLIQYLIIDQNKPPYLATKEQISFIDKDIDTQFILKATKASGKTSSILLKAILEKLKNPKIEIVIIKTTRLACDKLKQRLINTIEKAIVEIDLTSIKIITPNDVVNKHLTKLKKPNLEATLHIDSKLMKKKLNIADLILCDDVDLLSVEFVEYLKHIQKNKPLVLVQNYVEKNDKVINLTKDFRKKNRKIIFKQTNQLAKALQLIAELLKNNNPKDILVVSDKVNKKKLNEDLEHFIKEKAVLLNSSDSLINQQLDSFILSSYSEISGLESKFVILLDIEDSPPNEVEYAVNLSTEISYILFQNDSSEIKNLKVKYENN